MLWNVRDNDTRPGKQCRFQAKRRLVMQGILPPGCNPLKEILRNGIQSHNSLQFVGSKCVLLSHHLFTSIPNAANPARPRQNQPAMIWCASVMRKMPPASEAASIKDQLKQPAPDVSPLALQLLRPRKRIFPCGRLSASLTSICPLSSLVIACSRERGSVSSTRPASSTWLKKRCSVCSIPSASSPRNLRA